jgi:hypothetical protein
VGAGLAENAPNPVAAAGVAANAPNPVAATGLAAKAPNPVAAAGLAANVPNPPPEEEVDPNVGALALDVPNAPNTDFAFSASDKGMVVSFASGGEPKIELPVEPKLKPPPAADEGASGKLLVVVDLLADPIVDV